MRTADIRLQLWTQFHRGNFVSPRGERTVEVIGQSFLADEDHIFGSVNEDYVRREIAWYESQSLNVNDIPEPVPEIWRKVSTPDGWVNSNYGYLIWSESNYEQYAHVRDELLRDPSSRRAIMIYTRPSMHYDWNDGGMADFCCTSTVQYFVRNGALHSVVNMRSNDAYFGYRNDRAWQLHVLEKLAAELKVDVGKIHWQVGSLHFYERHFYLLHHWGELGQAKETDITRERYRELYPDSEWAR